ncbi:hypothetical protein, partial [Bradyrhizobium canariense]|uniref:hypothetical protein n=1 Tax=Bradyrhizobium canariense TaxID=255045 RepID=UPI0018E965CD
FKLIVKDSGDWGAMTHDGSENKALGVNFGGTGGTTEEQARTSLKVYKLDRTNLGEKHLDSITGEGDGPGIYMQSSSALATASRAILRLRQVCLRFFLMELTVQALAFRDLRLLLIWVLPQNLEILKTNTQERVAALFT